MNSSCAWSEWKPTAAALGVCLAAFLLQVRAWHVGHEAGAIALLGCNALRLPLLLLAWWPLAATFKAVAREETPDAATGVTVFDVIGVSLSFVGCLGCYPVWPVILVLLASLFLPGWAIPRKGARRPPGRMVLRLVLAVLLFTLSWYLCASTTRQALRGLEARIEASGEADRLTAWVKEVIAAHQRGEHPQRLERNEIPEFVTELMGPFQGVRTAMIEADRGEHCVTLLTGGSAYHFRISICPAKAGDGPPTGWFAETSELAWRHGIYVGTGGK